MSGTAALYLANGLLDLNADGLVDNEDARWLLQLTATDLGNVGRDSVFGYGLVNANFGTFGDNNGTVPSRPVHIHRAAGRNGVVTIRGSGFGVYARRSGTAVRGRFAIQRKRPIRKWHDYFLGRWKNRRPVVLTFDSESSHGQVHIR